jgi:hypothetical protein
MFFFLCDIRVYCRSRLRFNMGVGMAFFIKKIQLLPMVRPISMSKDHSEHCSSSSFLSKIAMLQNECVFSNQFQFIKKGSALRREAFLQHTYLSKFTADSVFTESNIKMGLKFILFGNLYPIFL